MKRATLALLVVAAACGGDRPSSSAAAAPSDKEAAETASNTAECLRLEDHVFEIMPRPETGHGESDPKRRAELVAQLPVEDIEQCAAVKDRKIIACMLQAADVATMRRCIPAATE